MTKDKKQKYKRNLQLKTKQIYLDTFMVNQFAYHEKKYT